ncbi:Endoplasmic reticulum-Golgi intermediate compartment protein 3 [Porphyridium purpureum]|uniref:Endoplasmic reticulum-Golgi intermediate compartment protein 3 n=1 Tax=Porphyridium purpureum TaxID=35688 RepID=A0A5J4Z6V9_PORPP|nr:Endoplasmic reticulum-Golgi intermediate compartment protein 3 [Porphyridium purpureum]|eukprot:POR6135..scf295_1
MLAAGRGVSSGGGGSGLSSRLTGWDTFSKTVEEFREYTFTGGMISLLSVGVILVLTLFEFVNYLSPDRHTEFLVDSERLGTMKIFLDIDFPALRCDWLGIDAIEMSGKSQLSIENHLSKTQLGGGLAAVENSGDTASTVAKQGLTKRLMASGRASRLRNRVSPSGSAQKDAANGAPNQAFHLSQHVQPVSKDYCGSCYGALKEGECCNTCNDVRRAFQKRGWVLDSTNSIEQCVREGVVSVDGADDDSAAGVAGCNIRGYVEIDKIAGNLHILPGRTYEAEGQLLYDANNIEFSKMNLSHTIHHFTIGDSFPGRTNPLDGASKTMQEDGYPGQHEYFLKVVPTAYKSIGWWNRMRSDIADTYQYSVTEYFHRVSEKDYISSQPGVYFVYDLSPIAVVYEDRRNSFASFLVQLCAIVGGVFTVSGMLDSSIHTSAKVVQKMRMGKKD